MGTKETILKLLLPVLFLGLLILPLLNSQLGIWKFERRSENRTFKETLSININKLDAFPAEAEEYINDNFSFRTPLLNAFHYSKFHYFISSPYPDKTIVGSDNWFFMAKKEKSIYEGKLNFSEDELDAYLAEWQRRKTYLDSAGIQTYWMIAPFKHYVYEDKLPFHIYEAKKRRVDQIKEHFQDYLPDLIIDPLPKLLEARSEEKLFYKLDNHWNYKAGKIATEELLHRMNSDMPQSAPSELAEFTWLDTTRCTGIHYSVIGIDDLCEKEQFLDKSFFNSQAKENYGFPVIKNFAYPSEYEICFKNDSAPSDLKVLFIRDSFANQMMPFVRETFQESVFIFDAWRYQLNAEIIEAVKPDVVVYLGLETHLENMLKDYTSKE